MKDLITVNAKAIVALVVPWVVAGLASVGLDADVNAVSVLVTSLVTMAGVWITRNAQGAVKVDG